MKRKIVGVALGILVVLVGAVLVFGLHGLYMIWRHEVFVPATYETVTPPLPFATTGGPRVLVFSKTNGFRHVDAIPAANALLARFAEEEAWDIHFSENAATHVANTLDHIDLVVWNNVSGDVLTPEQRSDFKAWLSDGGRVLAMHATGGDPVYQWDWHPAEFIRAQFIGHPILPQFQNAVVHIEDQSHPAMAHLPERWTVKDEWYSFKTSPRDQVHVLASLDESTYWPTLVGPFGDLRMGDHPIIWHHAVGQGVVFYTALGHRAETYEDPDYQTLLKNAALWLLDLD